MRQRDPDTKRQLLHFGTGNSKLGAGIGTFYLPSGHTCPGAKACLAKAALDKKTGKWRIKDGKHQQFRCFSASTEVVRRNVREIAWGNLNLLKGKTAKAMVEIISDSIELYLWRNHSIRTFRIHVGGDFFSQTYFDAWMEVARQFPKRNFYAYTKSLNYWKNRKDNIPENFRLTASHGGSMDHLIKEEGFRSVRVVMSPEEAEALNLEIDHDDRHAQEDGGSFALLIHGVQPAGSAPAKAMIDMRKRGIKFSYSSKPDRVVRSPKRDVNAA